MSLVQILEKDIPLPFSRRLVNRLNPTAFDKLEGYMDGEGIIEKLTWDENGIIDVECDVAYPVSIHPANLILYECELAYYVISPDDHQFYTYPKTYFTLIRKSISPSSELCQKI